MKLIFRPIHRPAEIYASVTKGPLPQTSLDYLEMHSFGFPDRPTVDNLPVSVRLAAAGKEVHERMKVLTSVLRRLENLGWAVRLEGDQVVVECELGIEAGWEVLRREGVADHVMGQAEKGSDLPPARGPAGGGEPVDPYFPVRAPG